MNPNQTNNSLPPLPNQDLGGQGNPLMQPPAQMPGQMAAPQSMPAAQNNDVQPMPEVPTANSGEKSEWNSTPWMLGIFVLLVLIAVLTIVALNVYNRPAGGTNNTSSRPSSSVASSVASSQNAYGITISSLTYNSAAGEWNYEISGNKPTPCHSVTAEAIVMESFPEQVMININLATPEEDSVCIQVIDEFSLTGTFKASEQATARIGTVRVT